MAYIEVKQNSKFYISGETKTYANREISFTVEKGELVVILGASGAGKSTLLNILGGMDTNDSGEVWIEGVDIAQFTDQQRTIYRRNDVGFVFQFYNLVPNLTALENVELAAEIVPDALDASSALTAVGLEHRLHHFPAQLSGGEQQRVSIARAIAKKPKMLLCDEPTGALDYQTGKQILALLQTMAQQYKTTVIIVTHNSALAAIANRVIHLHDAQIKSITENPTPATIESIDY